MSSKHIDLGSNPNNETIMIIGVIHIHSFMRSLPEDEFADIVNSSKTILEALRKMGYTYTGGTARVTFKRLCEERGLDISHLTNHAGGKQLLKQDEIFVKDSKVSQTSLREHYLSGKFSDYKCSICGINTWMGNPLTLRLDHINGTHNDDILENLRLVCPNFDSQLPTFYSGHKGLFKVRYYCVDCGIELKNNRKRCSGCNEKYIANKKSRTKYAIPNRDELKHDIRNLSRNELINKYNVSDKTIAKWCDALSLPHKLYDIRKYTDEEWENEVPFSSVVQRIETERHKHP